MAQFGALAERYGQEQELEDHRFARICWILAETNRDRKRRTRAYTPEDFMPVRQRQGINSQEVLAGKVKTMFNFLKSTSQRQIKDQPEAGSG